MNKLYDQPKPSKAKQFSEDEMLTSSFYHEYGTCVGRRATHGHLGMVKQMDDGYCQMAEFGQKGIKLPLITAWSGCLFVEGELDKEDRNALEQVRKISDVVATEKAQNKTA